MLSRTLRYNSSERKSLFSKTPNKGNSAGAIIVALTLLCSPLYSQPETTGYKKANDNSKVKQEIAAGTKTVQTVHGDFIQQKKSEFIEGTAVSEGKFIKSGRNLRWEYLEPYQYTVVLKDEKMVIQNQGKERQAPSGKMFKYINKLMFAATDGNAEVGNDFTVNYYFNDEFYLAELISQNKQISKYVQSVFVWISRADFSAEKFKLVETEGDYTQIEFKNKVLNMPLTDEAFR